MAVIVTDDGLLASCVTVTYSVVVLVTVLSVVLAGQKRTELEMID